MPITRWDPFRDVTTLQNRLNSLFQDYNRAEGEPVAAASFIPPVDIYEDDHQIVLKLEVPGMKQEDLDIQLENNNLTVRGERKFENEEKEENFHRIERRYGSFVRNFSLPQTIDTNNVTANYDAGVLTISLAKKAESKPKQVKIAVGGPKQVQGGKSEDSKQVEASKPNESRQVEAKSAA